MKVKVLKDFVDTHTKALQVADSEVEMTETRFNEAVRNLEKYGGGFLQAIEAAEDDGGDKPLADMKKDELLAYVKDKEIDLGDAKTKEEILQAIEAAEKE